MTLRKKTVFIMSVPGIVLLLILALISYTIVLKSFAEIENDHVREHLERTLVLIENNLASLSSTVGDWAIWDDTYNFLGGTYENYAVDNLMDTTFVTLKIHLMVFLDTAGKIVLGKAVALEEEQEVPLPEDLAAYLTPESPLRQHSTETSSTTGILSLAEGPLLLASRPIVTSDGEGPIRGTLLMGYYLDAAEIERLAQLTNCSLSVYQVQYDVIPPDIQRILPEFSEKETVVVHPLTDTMIAGYAFINDIYEKPEILIKVEIPREIYQHGQRSVVYFILSLVVITVILSGMMLFLMEKTVLARVARLSAGVRNIRTSHDLSSPIVMPGRDELSDLGQEMNALLSSLQRSQQELRESEQRYRRLMENSPLGIMLINRQGAVIDVNPMFVAILGAPSVEAIHGLNVLSSSDFLQAGMVEDFRQCLSSGELLIARECVYESQWGKHLSFMYYMTPLYGINGDITGAQAIVEDITERKWAEKSLRESETEYHSLFKNLLNGLAYHKIVLDDHQQPIDCIFLEINQAYEELFGFGKEIIGRRMTELFPTIREMEPDVIRIFGSVALTGEEQRFEFYFAPFESWYAVSAYSPEPGYFTALFEDVTERKFAEETLRQINEQLEQRVEARTIELRQANTALQELLEALNQTQEQLVQSEKMAALGGLVAGMAHEINTPLGVAITAASYLERQTDDIEHLYYDKSMKRSQWEQYLNMSKESTQLLMRNLQSITKQIQGFKQVSVKETDVQKHRFYLKNHLDTIFLSLKPSFQKISQHVEVQVNCPEDLLIESYPMAFSQILTNFVMNSLMHGFEQRPHGQIRLDILKNEQSLRIIYQDDGKGMTAEEYTHIFEPFYTTKRTQGGMGLGLHIVFNLVTQLLKGQIVCESSPGVGTTFTIQLPL